LSTAYSLLSLRLQQVLLSECLQRSMRPQLRPSDSDKFPKDRRPQRPLVHLTELSTTDYPTHPLLTPVQLSQQRLAISKRKTMSPSLALGP
jgi:hypothetical protein